MLAWPARRRMPTTVPKDGGHDLGCAAGADGGSVFLEGDVVNPVQAVLDAPMPTNPGRGLVRGSGGHRHRRFRWLLPPESRADVVLPPARSANAVNERAPTHTVANVIDRITASRCRISRRARGAGTRPRTSRIESVRHQGMRGRR